MTRPITIEPVLNGFVVQVGCQRVVFNNINELCDNLRAYYRDPRTMEKAFIEKRLNETMDDLPRVAPPRGEPLNAMTEQCATAEVPCEQPRGLRR